MLRHDFKWITKEFTVEDVLTIKEEYIKYAEKIANEKE
jgi:hypothetical protein